VGVRLWGCERVDKGDTALFIHPPILPQGSRKVGYSSLEQCYNTNLEENALRCVYDTSLFLRNLL
jgi:hypothetical protein